MSGMVPSGSKIDKLFKLALVIILLCIAAEMIKTTFYSTLLPMLPWILGGAVLFLGGVYVWNRMTR